MAQACSPEDVDVARKQAHKLISEAETMLKKHKGKFPMCDQQLASAKLVLKQAEAISGSPREQRDALLRATFHAGQARVCPIVKGIETGKLVPGTSRKSKRPRK